MFQSHLSSLYQLVTSAVVATDPIDLLGYGCPEDEYDPEVFDLISIITRTGDLSAAMVKTVFERWFGADMITDEAARQISAQVRAILIAQLN